MGTIGKYQIDRKIGQGGMGIVYLCHDSETEQRAAVKVLPQQLAGDPVFFQRFKREVQILQRLDHQGVVKIFDRGLHDGAPWYAMEFVEGRSLDDILEGKEKMEPLRAIAIIRACADALRHSHSLGVIHRDIKPANIMVADDGAVKLMDFGIAKMLDATRMTVTQGVLGTVEYMSPEQSQGRHVDARTDLYSLGAVLYQCLTAHRPITGTNPTEVILKLRTHQVESPEAWAPELPRRLTELVMRLLDKDPLKRPESAQELIRDLDRIRRQIERKMSGDADAVVSERVISSGLRHGYPLLRSPWLYLLLLAIVAVVLFNLTSEPEPEGNSNTETHKVNYQVVVRGAILRARKAAARKEFDYAISICRGEQKYHPAAAEKENVDKVILEIEKARAEYEAKKKLEAEEARKKLEAEKESSSEEAPDATEKKKDTTGDDTP